MSDQPVYVRGVVVNGIVSGETIQVEIKIGSKPHSGPIPSDLVYPDQQETPQPNYPLKVWVQGTVHLRDWEKGETLVLIKDLAGAVVNHIIFAKTDEVSFEPRPVTESFAVITRGA